MNRLESVTRPLMWLMALMLVALAAGCGGGGGGGQDPILGTGGIIATGTIPGAPLGAILPGAVCTVAADPTIPKVTLSDPTSNNQFVTTSTSGVANSGKLITATFSLAMNPTTINSATAPLTFTLKNTATGTNVPGIVTMNAANTFATLTTASALLPDTSYTAIITKDATSAVGSTLACIVAWNFKTAIPADAGQAPRNGKYLWHICWCRRQCHP